MDRLGPRKVVPIGAAMVGVGALLFATGDSELASIGRLLQGAGGVFALVGAAYIATTNFPASRAATLIGATQMFGMAGGSAGQFVVGPLMAAGTAWSIVLDRHGHRRPRDQRAARIPAADIEARRPARTLAGRRRCARSVAYSAIRSRFSAGSSRGCCSYRRRSSTWSGACAICRRRAVSTTATAVMRSARVPFGWIIGCPLLGFVSDRIGRRKPVIIGGAAVLLGCLAWILYGPADFLPPYVLGIVAGVGSGAAMLPYTVIKEANPPELGGTATGVVNFVNFTFSALLGPVFARLLLRVSGGASPMVEAHYQSAFQPMLYGVALAIALTLLLKETGPAARVALARVQEAR